MHWHFEMSTFVEKWGNAKAKTPARTTSRSLTVTKSHIVTPSIQHISHNASGYIVSQAHALEKVYCTELYCRTRGDSRKEVIENNSQKLLTAKVILFKFSSTSDPLLPFSP